jgi:hypothetical protein
MTAMPKTETKWYPPTQANVESRLR